MTVLTPIELQSWLEWAGAKLVAIPGLRIRPNDPRSTWPDYSQDRFEILAFRGNAPIRAGAPSKDEIPLMDEILLLPNLSPKELHRRVLHARLLMHPIRGYHLISWAKLARRLRSDPKTIKRYHAWGLDEVTSRMPQKQVYRIEAALENAIPASRNTA